MQLYEDRDLGFRGFGEGWLGGGVWAHVFAGEGLEPGSGFGVFVAFAWPGNKGLRLGFGGLGGLAGGGAGVLCVRVRGSDWGRALRVGQGRHQKSSGRVRKWRVVAWVTSKGLALG